jgi:type II secretory pathway pseudopilin PulG
MKLVKNVRGDTILEVLISIVIISVILTGAYITSSNSTDNIRAAQERVQAIGIAQQQIEDLRDQVNNIFCSGTTPCTQNVVNHPYLTGASAFCFNGGSDNNSFEAYTLGNCTIGYNSSNTYIVKVQNNGGGPTDGATIPTYTFLVNVTWNINPTTGQGDNLNMYYRLSI